MKALLKVGYGCNEHCSFCHTQDVRHIDGSSAEVLAKIDRAHALGHTMVVLSGGEATIRPELFAWAEAIATRGMDLGLVTNGLMLAYPHVLDRLLALRLRYVYMSLHGGEARIHDRLVRRKSFDTAASALASLSGRGLDLTANCVVTKHNVDHLDALVDHVAVLPDVRLKFSWVEPKGGAAHLIDALVPDLQRAAKAVDQALARWDETTADPVRAVHGGFPLCTLPGHEHRFDDLRTHGYWTMSEIGEPDLFPVDDRNKAKPAQCDGCALRGGCPGVFNDYLERVQPGVLRPRLDTPRSNSIDFVFERLVTRTHGDDDACPVLHDGWRPYDRARHIFVRHGPRIGRYAAWSRDFDDAQLEAIKFDTGQLYLDASRKDAPDDFARDLVKLTRSPSCEGCEAQEHCAGMFEPSFESVFVRDDAAVIERLAALRGRVLDVGCGDMPYADTLRESIEAGVVQYVGIDPDEAAVQRVRDRLPAAARLRHGGLEQLEPHERFDHVLVLRSWNHLPASPQTTARLVDLLAPGGSLLVVDNVAFGLVRTPSQTQRGAHGGSGWEHRRNDDARTAHASLARTGLALIERVDVDPTRSNQWMLRYTRSA